MYNNHSRSTMLFVCVLRRKSTGTILCEQQLQQIREQNSIKGKYTRRKQQFCPNKPLVFWGNKSTVLASQLQSHVAFTFRFVRHTSNAGLKHSVPPLLHVSALILNSNHRTNKLSNLSAPSSAFYLDVVAELCICTVPQNHRGRVLNTSACLDA